MDYMDHYLDMILSGMDSDEARIAAAEAMMEEDED
jgi:hypothetical protein